MKCPKCGKPMAQGIAVCKSCGWKSADPHPGYVLGLSNRARIGTI